MAEGMDIFPSNRKSQPVLLRLDLNQTQPPGTMNAKAFSV